MSTFTFSAYYYFTVRICIRISSIVTAIVYTSRLINRSLTINRLHIHTFYKKHKYKHSDDSNIVQVPAAAATPAASNNGPPLVENADGDDTISEDLVNRTQNSPTSSTNEQETEGTYY